MSTFGSLTTVRLGIYSAQKGLDVTGNNITNINTPGYSRQRLNQVSLVPSVSDRYSSSYNTRIGQGAVVAGVNQLRDPCMDISYRKAAADVGSANSKLTGLNDLATILDEVGKGSLDQDDGVILSQLNDLRDLISQAITNGVDTYNALIRESATSLVGHFNSYATQLANLEKTYQEKLDQEISTVNDILANIRDLNLAIRDADIRGDPGLELRDERNRLLDELNQYVKVDVKYSTEDVGAGTMVEKLTVSLATGDKNTLVDGQYAAQFSQELLKRNEKFDPTKNLGPNNRPYLDANDNQVTATDKAEVLDNSNYTLVLGPLTNDRGEKLSETDFGCDLGDTDLYGSIQSIRELLTEKGEFSTDADVQADPDATTKRGIPYYRKALDSLAQTFAQEMNNLNHVYDEKGQLVAGGNLFSMGSNTNDASAITAANISVSYAWANDQVSIQAKDDPNAPSGDTSRLAKFLNLFNREDIKFDPSKVNAGATGESYEGSFEDMLLRIQSTLAEDQKTTDAVLNNYMITANDLAVNRDSVMGVDLNDEASNLMIYQKAYTAACRLMTSLEKALDSLLAM